MLEAGHPRHRRCLCENVQIDPTPYQRLTDPVSSIPEVPTHKKKWCWVWGRLEAGHADSFQSLGLQLVHDSHKTRDQFCER